MNRLGSLEVPDGIIRLLYEENILEPQARIFLEITTTGAVIDKHQEQIKIMQHAVQVIFHHLSDIRVLKNSVKRPENYMKYFAVGEELDAGMQIMGFEGTEYASYFSIEKIMEGDEDYTLEVMHRSLPKMRKGLDQTMLGLVEFPKYQIGSQLWDGRIIKHIGPDGLLHIIPAGESEDDQIIRTSLDDLYALDPTT